MKSKCEDMKNWKRKENKKDKLMKWESVLFHQLYKLVEHKEIEVITQRRLKRDYLKEDKLNSKKCNKFRNRCSLNLNHQ
jgi:hypothetical protein